MPEELDKLRILLDAQDDIRVAFAFGSVAAGTPKADSDLDIGVAGSEPLSSTRRMELIETIARCTGRPVDLVDLNTAGPVVLTRALSRGKKILVNGTDLYARLLSRMQFGNADLLPYIERTHRERRKDFGRG